MIFVFILALGVCGCVPAQGCPLLCSCHREINSLSCHDDVVFKRRGNHFETHENFMKMSILQQLTKSRNHPLMLFGSAMKVNASFLLVRPLFR